MKTPEFTRPSRPDPSPILLLHRRHDGFVSFHRKHPGTCEHEDLFSVKARDIDQYFPSMSPLLERDAYFSVNAFFRGGHGFARNSPDGLTLDRAERKNDSLRWLTACFADIDCQDLGITTGQAIGVIIDAQDEGRIPPASLLTRSGRGVWAFWFLVADDNDRKPVRAWEENVRLYLNIQNRIGREFAAIGSDANAKLLVQITRVPGSINSKSRRRVDYWVQGDPDGKRYAYRLSELAGRLGVTVPKRSPGLESRVSTFTVKRAKGAWTGRWINARSNFELLWEMRGTFQPGTRNAAVFLYVTFLRGLRLDQETITDEAWRLFEAMAQTPAEPFTKDELLAAVKSAKGAENVSNQRIADMLDVTPDESAVLVAGRGWPPASRFGGPIPEVAKLPQAERTRRRRNLLRARVQTLGAKWPGLKWFADWLTEQGIECSPNTVKHDLEAIGVRNPNAYGKRTKKKQDPELF